MSLVTPNTTHYQGYDIAHDRRWYSVTIGKDTLDSTLNSVDHEQLGEHYFVDLRAAMDFCDEQFNKRWKLQNN